jgi:hypothetical protein
MYRLRSSPIKTVSFPCSSVQTLQTQCSPYLNGNAPTRAGSCQYSIVPSPLLEEANILNWSVMGRGPLLAGCVRVRGLWKMWTVSQPRAQTVRSAGAIRAVLQRETPHGVLYPVHWRGSLYTTGSHLLQSLQRRTSERILTVTKWLALHRSSLGLCSSNLMEPFKNVCHNSAQEG